MAFECDFTQTKQCSYKKLKVGLVFAKLLHMKKIKVYTLQGKWTGDFDSNNKWYKDEALKLKGKDIDLLVLPELFHTPYFPFEENADFFDLAIEKDHPIVAEWQAIAKELNAVVVFPFFEKRARGIYHNSAFVFERDGSIAGLYRKSHMPKIHRPKAKELE